MIDFTGLARALMKRRTEAAKSWRGEGIETVQRRQLSMLLKKMAATKRGRELGLRADDSYETFREKAACTPYPGIREWVMRMVDGEADVLWPGVTRRFAQSSGTSDGKSKFIPVTNDSLKLNHYRGASDAVAHYLRNYPDSRMFSGKGFILGGSFANELTLKKDVRVGDLSANLIEAINPIVNLMRVPDKKTALMTDWSQKVPALTDASIHENITNISGVPSWFLTVIKEVMKKAGVSSIHEVWPNLEVFFHGGISMEPYRSQYAAVTDPGKMRYVETYNASEGFFAVQDLREPGSMLLLLDAGIFYEFVPLDEADAQRPPHAVPAWEVKQGKTYALVITAPNGLTRYPIGDTVRITEKDPLRIAIAGRTRHYINAFGEEVMVFNTDAAIARACEATGAAVANYTVAPVFAMNANSKGAGPKKGRHQWLIEWAKAPEDIDQFSDILDRALQSENSDYQAKRSGGIFLDRLTITTARTGLFDRWLASTGKLGGQRKVPRLSNDRTLMDTMLAMNE